MAYIGNTAPSRFVSNRAASVYSGDGSTTAFTLEQVVTQDEDVLVSVDGVVQEPSVAYAVSNGTTLTFTAAPSSNAGNNIFVYYLASQVGTVGHPSNQALSATNGTFSGNTTVAGTSTFTGDVTIGDASAADKKILFDGNAQDYHIGLDDSTDSLTIGLGSALGTTSHIVTNASGEVTKPLQPSFLVHKGGTAQSNFSRNADVLVTLDTEVFDVGANFASNNFTAPVTGKYVLHAKVRMSEIDSDATYYVVHIVTSNRNYSSIYDPRGYDQDPVNFNFNESAIVDMDANDTANVQIYQAVGTDGHTSISGSSSYTNFGGYLLG